MNCNIFRPLDDFVRQGRGEQSLKRALRRAPDHNLRDIFKAAETQDFCRQVISDKRLRFAAEGLRQFDGVIDACSRLMAELLSGALDGHGDPWRIHQVGQALCRSDDGFSTGAGADTGHDAFARRPGAFDGVGLHARNEIDVDTFGGPP